MACLMALATPSSFSSFTNLILGIRSSLSTRFSSISKGMLLMTTRWPPELLRVYMDLRNSMAARKVAHSIARIRVNQAKMAGIMVGDTLSSYRILARAGQGRTGTVYLAERMRDGLRVRLKVLHPEITADPERLGRIVCAARRLMEFGHPGIARVLEITGPDAGSGAMSIVAEWV